MENHIMKKYKTSLTGFVLGIMVLLVGIQGAMAQFNTAPVTCKGTVYLKAPADWDAAYIGGKNVNNVKRMTLNDEGFFQYDLANLGITDNQNPGFSIGNKASGAGLQIINASRFAFAATNTNDTNWPTNNATIQCPGEGRSVYVSESPQRAGFTYTGAYAADAKYFFMLVPDEKEWQSDDLMISYTTSRGTKKDTALAPSSELCGWVYMVFNTPPDDAVIYLKNTPTTQLGLNGLWDDDEVADPIDLALVFDAFSVNKLYFIPDDAAWPPGDDSKGWYTVDPGVTGTCQFTLAAVIYDTDMSLNPAFSDCCGQDKGNNNRLVDACVGVQHGLVEVDLGPDNKPKFSGSTAARNCFGGGTDAEANFYALFNYVQGKNEVQCYDMPFRHYGTDTRWGFDSDSTETMSGRNKIIGGFYPLENSSDTGVVTLMINGVPTKAGPLLAARKKREAAGPVPNNAKEALGVELDYYCKTPGWPNGKDCQGRFADGSEFTDPDLWCWGSYCADAFGVPGFNRWGDCDGCDFPTETRNQHFCFESHANFTYNEGQEFTFRGDDDIWVFINKKIAVDNGGAHLAAPGHVVLKNLNAHYTPGCSGDNCFLVPGKDYPIDIFFCDRRTSMSNVIIKTNMYIKQSTGIDFTTKDLGNGGLEMDICVEKTGGGDCAAVALGGGGGQTTTKECGNDISENIAYSIKTRKKEIPPNCADCAALPLGGTVHGGIDLSNPKMPIVYPEKVTGLAPGTYYLYFTVNGKEAAYKFRVKGNLGIVSNDVTFNDIDEAGAAYPNGTQWKFVDKALAGTRIPIYVSAPAEDGTVDIISPPGQSYTLILSAGANLYKNKDDEIPLVVPFAGQVNPTGIDTFWVDVPLAGLSSAVQEIVATVGNTSAKLSFFAPKLDFATPKTKDADGNVTDWDYVVEDPNVDQDGSEYFHWVNSDVDFYLVVRDPSTGLICKECNFSIDALEKSEGLEIMVSAFTEGVALVRVRSSKEYSTEAATMLVGSLENGGIAAPYGNMHFFKPPAPMPLIVDIFDVKGAPLGEMNIPSEYYTESADYLDGRADSLAIIYDRQIHKDSVPTFICLHFDDDHLTKINPYKMGISNNKRDTLMECSTQFDSATVWKAYEKSPNNGRTLVFSVDSAFTVDVKTLVKPENKIASFTEYEWKHMPVRTFFEKGLTDRIAPVILSARASAETDGGVYDLLTIAVSEPVIFTDANNGTQSFTYYLNSAINSQERDRFTHATAQGRPQDRRDTLTMRYYNANVQNPTPHVGDYIRFRADAFMWVDTSNGAAPGSDTLRLASDAAMHWNSPTDYKATDRLPSPWVQVVGDAKIDVTTISFNYSDPTAVNDSTPVGKVYPVKTNESLDDIKEKYPGKLGHFVQSDMGAIIGSDTAYAKVEKGDVVFHYEVDYFTNLGAFVARQKGKIACDDPFFSATPEGPAHSGDCVKNPRNFFIAWNMLSKQNRLVGTGAYITKYASYVKLGNMGKKAKKELTEVWGVKRGKNKATKK
ncbi:MAG: fibro-slime domain-containing protein [Fibrobacter sp.]|uniref:fibro-slime domain-containing protein n=1 Tax=Fibrobacter sp. TaxID=35828 RepID=UPI0025BEBF97|nr:fibro-slime domain-containing protein [Fibrobacter sp.]MBR4783804.1 fibro-slime domain-containing protein [Fibrobacter sp.]